MRRLTRDELVASIETVLGVEATESETVQRAIARIPLESPGDLVQSFQNGHAFDHVEGILLTAEAIAARVAGEANLRAGVFGDCAEQTDTSCAEQFLDTTALGLMRRPLDAERRDALLAGFRDEGAGLAGMEWLLARVLQSPEMVFHLELPETRCTEGPAVVAESFAWDDAAAFFAPNGGDRTAPPETLAEPGWFVWELPGARIPSAMRELAVEVTATSEDRTPLEVSVNLNDVPLIATTLVAPGEQTLRASVSVAAGTATKVGVYFANAAAGRSLQVRSLSLTPETARVECVVEPAADGAIAVDSWTVASRLSYALTGTVPDAALLGAAAARELGTVEQVRTHAERLIETAAARRQLARMLDSWLNLSAIPTPNRVIASLAGIDGTGLAEEARQELIDTVTHLVLDKDADAQTLMSAKIGFPRSERMAKLYGTAIASGDQPVELTRGHGGLLLRIAPLLSGQLSSSPILRGVYVRKRILCDSLPSPDFTIVNSRVEQFEAVSHEDHSTREIVTQITSEGACPDCHRLINPVGFALERFDPLGQPRTEEIVYNVEGVEIARHPIDSSVAEANLEPGLPAELTGAEDLAAALADSRKVRACIAERMVTQARVRPRSPEDECTLAEVEQALIAGASLREAWIASVVNPDLFVREAEGSAP